MHGKLNTNVSRLTVSSRNTVEQLVMSCHMCRYEHDEVVKHWHEQVRAIVWTVVASTKLIPKDNFMTIRMDSAHSPFWLGTLQGPA